MTSFGLVRFRVFLIGSFENVMILGTGLGQSRWREEILGAYLVLFLLALVPDLDAEEDAEDDIISGWSTSNAY